MTNGQPRLALVVDPTEPERYPAHELCAAALEEGWRAEIVYDRTAPRIPDLAALLRAMRRRPFEVLLSARPQAAPPGRRLRLRTVMLGPQVLHLPSARAASAWIGLARRLQARTIVNVDGEELSAMAFDPPANCGPAWQTADCFHVESEAFAELLSKQGAPPERIRVIQPAADPTLLAEDPQTPPGPRPLRILSAGPLSWTHCYEHAVQAIRLLQDRTIPAEYRILGRGAHLDAVVFAVHELGLQGRVQVIESDTPTELRAHLRWADVFLQVAVVPSSATGILQAQAAGVPVVTSAPADDQLDSVLAVPALDPTALADALVRLRQDGMLRTRLVASGRERARRAPTPAAETRRLHALHRALLADV